MIKRKQRNSLTLWERKIRHARRSAEKALSKGDKRAVINQQRRIANLDMDRIVEALDEHTSSK